jgi:hypothetical protein
MRKPRAGHFWVCTQECHPLVKSGLGGITPCACSAAPGGVRHRATWQRSHRSRKTACGPPPSTAGIGLPFRQSTTSSLCSSHGIAVSRVGAGADPAQKHMSFASGSSQGTCFKTRRAKRTLRVLGRVPLSLLLGTRALSSNLSEAFAVKDQPLRLSARAATYDWLWPFQPILPE